MKQKTNKQIKPIQMIKFDQKKSIFYILLSQQAIDIFNQLQTTQLCIVCVAGKYRTGKSYILNRVLLEQNHGFEVGPTINACTKGLWMWPEIVKINFCGHQKQCILIDTEGLGSLQEGQNTDIKIFLMATLLSSYLIYNSVGTIDQKALESLNLVINMATLLQKNGDKFDSQEIINSFPSFMWLVRDFSLKLQDQTGQQITSQQYLQNALKTQKGKSLAVERKNQIRKQLKTFFQQRDCFTLIRPTLNQKDLQNLSSLSQKKLRPEFVDLIRDLKKRIHFGIQPKKIRGKSITPQGFIQLCNYYINNINSGKLPSINSNWDNLCMNESGRLIQKYKQKLRQYNLLNSIKNQQIDELNLKNFYTELLNEAFETVQKSFLGKLEKKLTKQKLQKSINDQLMDIFADKIKSQQKQVQYKFSEILDQLNDIIKFKQSQQSSGNSDFLSKIQKIRNVFGELQLLMEESENRNILSSIGQFDKSKNFNKKIYQELFCYVKQNILSYVEQQIFDINQKIIQQKQKNTSKITKLQTNLQTKLKQCKNIAKLLQATQFQSNQLSTKNKHMKKQLQQAKQEMFNLSQTIKSQQKTISQLKQLKVIDIHKIKQQIQNEYKLKLKSMQQKLQIKQQKIQDLTQQIKQHQIKQRKLQRQSQIYKQKFIQLQKDNQNLIKFNQNLKNQMQNTQKQNRNLIRKTSYKALKANKKLQNSLYKIKLQRSFYERAHLKTQPDQQQQQNNSTLNFNDEDEENQSIQTQSNQKIQQLLKKTKMLEIQSNKYLQENRNLYKLLNQQRSINQILTKSSHSINYQSLKKNYQIQRNIAQQNLRKLEQYQSIFSCVNRLECKLCQQLINKNGNFINHFQKCMRHQKKQLNFDVSYVYDADGQLKFLFQIQMEDLNSDENKDPLERLGLNQKKQSKWEITKSLKSIQLFLSKIDRLESSNHLFQQKQLQGQQVLNKKKQQTQNLNQQRRLFLQQTFHKLKSQIWKNKEYLEYFGIDLHLMKMNISKKRQKLNKVDNTSFKRKRKIGLLNLELGQITEQINQNDNQQMNWNKRVLSESANLMKTTKFSQKKTFRFTPNF